MLKITAFISLHHNASFIGHARMEDAKMDSTDAANTRTDLTKLLRRFETRTPDQNTRNYFHIYLTAVVILLLPYRQYSTNIEKHKNTREYSCHLTIFCRQRE